MDLEKIRSAHASDEDLIGLLYCGDSSGSHVAGCSTCQNRLFALQLHRAQIERDQLPGTDADFAFLADQRRTIYARLTQSQSLWSRSAAAAWISAGATAMMLAGGLLVFQHNHQGPRPEDQISDAELAQEVSGLSQNAEARPAQPLQGLFEQ